MFPHHGRVPDTARALRRHEQKQGSVCATHALLQWPSQPPLQQNGRCPYTSKWLPVERRYLHARPPPRKLHTFFFFIPHSIQKDLSCASCMIETVFKKLFIRPWKRICSLDGGARKCNMQFIRFFLTHRQRQLPCRFFCVCR